MNAFKKAKLQTIVDINHKVEENNINEFIQMCEANQKLCSSSTHHLKYSRTIPESKTTEKIKSSKKWFLINFKYSEIPRLVAQEEL